MKSKFILLTGKQKSFTMIELLIVIAIIGILASIIIPSLGEARKKAAAAEARTTLKQIRTALTLLEGDAQEWPGHRVVGVVDDGSGGNESWDLNAASAGLMTTDGSFPNWAGPYMSAGAIPTDPWGNNYFFDTDYDIDPEATTKWAAVIGSFGPNGVGQNVFDSDDIIEIIVTE